MTPFFVWLLKSSVSLALLYVVFKLAVSRNKMHTANRFVLLGILLSSVLLPFADIPFFRETTVVPQFEAIHEFIATPQEISIVPTQNEITETFVETATPLSSVNWWLVFYVAVIGVLAIRLVFSMARVLQIIRRAEKQNFRDVILAIVKDFIQPFSFLQHIVLSEKDFAENKDIVLAHEYAHIQHKHAIDLMICELFTALFWFNPFMWLLRRELKLIHEYQADEAVLNKGIDAKTYQLLVLKKAVGERRFALANNFTQKPILKRIKMMTTNKSKKTGALKMFLFVPVVALLLQAFAKPEIIVEKAEAYLPVIGNQDDNDTLIQLNKNYQFVSLVNGEFFCRGTFTFEKIDENGIWLGIQKNTTMQKNTLVTAKMVNNSLEIYTAEPWKETWKVNSKENGVYSGTVSASYKFAQNNVITFKLLDEGISLNKRYSFTSYVNKKVFCNGTFHFYNKDKNGVWYGIQKNTTMQKATLVTAKIVKDGLEIYTPEPWNEKWKVTSEDNGTSKGFVNGTYSLAQNNDITFELKEILSKE